MLLPLQMLHRSVGWKSSNIFWQLERNRTWGDVYLRLAWLLPKVSKRSARYCLLRGPDPNHEDTEDGTPLESAVFSGNRRIMEMLVKAGANCKHIDYYLD